MQYSFLITLILCIVYSPVYASNSYQSEFAYAYIKLDSDDGSDFTTMDIDFTHYLFPVDTKNHPLREAAFLEKASNISIAYNKSKEGGTSFDLNTDEITTLFQYINKEPAIPISFTAEYSTEDYDFDNSFSSGDEDTFGLGIGAYVQDQTLISLFYSQSDSASDSAAFSSKVETDTFDLAVKSVIEMGNNTAFSIEGEIEKSDYSFSTSPSGMFNIIPPPDTSSTVYLFSGTYYLNQRNGIGVELFKSDLDNDPAKSKGFVLFADVFLTKLHSIRFSLGRFTASDSTGPDLDSDFMGIIFAGRI